MQNEFIFHITYNASGRIHFCVPDIAHHFFCSTDRALLVEVLIKMLSQCACLLLTVVNCLWLRATLRTWDCMESVLVL
jgi:hypothetical protein